MKSYRLYIMIICVCLVLLALSCTSHGDARQVDNMSCESESEWMTYRDDSLSFIAAFDSIYYLAVNGRTAESIKYTDPIFQRISEGLPLTQSDITWLATNYSVSNLETENLCLAMFLVRNFEKYRCQERVVGNYFNSLPTDIRKSALKSLILDLYLGYAEEKNVESILNADCIDVAAADSLFRRQFPSIDSIRNINGLGWDEIINQDPQELFDTYRRNSLQVPAKENVERD